jgi:hypothetical protein
VAESREKKTTTIGMKTENNVCISIKHGF